MFLIEILTLLHEKAEYLYHNLRGEKIFLNSVKSD